MTHGSDSRFLNIGGVALWVLAVAGCQPPHDGLEAILKRQQVALAKLPAEDRRRLFPPAEPVATRDELTPVIPSPLSLEDARRIALQANPDVHAAQARLEAALARIGEARAAYFPVVSLVHNSTRNFLTPRSRNPQLGALSTQLPDLFSPNQQLDLGSIFSVITGRMLGNTTQGGNSNSFSQHSSLLTVSWTLFDGFVREARLLATKHSYRAAAMGLADVERLIVQAVDTAYLQGLLGREQLRIARADEGFSQEQLLAAEANWANGKGTRADVLNFQVRLRAAQANVTAAIGVLDTARVVLAELMGVPDARLPETVELPPLTEEAEADLAPLSEAIWMEQALRNRPDLAGRQHALGAAEENVRLARGQYSPALLVSGSYGFESRGSVSYSDNDESSALGVELNWQLFTGGFRTSQLRRAEAERREALANLQRQRLAIAAEVRRTIVSLLNAQEQVRLHRANLQSAEENRRIVAARYAEGKEPLVRLNEAQRDFVRTEADLATARIQLRQAWTDLQTAASSHVEPLDPDTSVRRPGATQPAPVVDSKDEGG